MACSPQLHPQRLADAAVATPVLALGTGQAEGVADLRAQTAVVQLERRRRSDAAMLAVHENRVGLPRQRRTKPQRLEPGEPAAKRTGSRSHGHGADGLHTTPTRERAERPDRNLLEADNVGIALGNETRHLFEPRRLGLGLGAPVREVPGACKQPQDSSVL